MTPLLSTLLNIATIAFGLGTAGAVLVHDTSIDKAMVTAIAVKSIDTSGSGTLSLGSNPHTHSERSSLFVISMHHNPARSLVEVMIENIFRQSQAHAVIIRLIITPYLW
jgi:hypothetical protein